MRRSTCLDNCHDQYQNQRRVVVVVKKHNCVEKYTASGVAEICVWLLFGLPRLHTVNRNFATVAKPPSTFFTMAGCKFSSSTSLCTMSSSADAILLQSGSSTSSGLSFPSFLKFRRPTAKLYSQRNSNGQQSLSLSSWSALKCPSTVLCLQTLRIHCIGCVSSLRRTAVPSWNSVLHRSSRRA